MTEREREQRRAELRRQISQQQCNISTQPEQRERKDFFLFRLYVSIILCGGILLLSRLQTETSIQVTERIKTMIAQELPQEFEQTVANFLNEHKVVLPAWESDSP